MKAMLKCLLCVAVLSVGMTAAMGQDSLSEQKKAQNKLLAYRAARVDGIRKLAERINGLHITSTTTVKDFVTESDKIRTSMEAFLNGVREDGAPKYMEDGTCQVTMQVTLETVIETLTQIHNTYAKGDKFTSNDFAQMTQTNDVKVLTETGNGAPRPEFTADQIQPVKGGDLTSMDNMSPRAKEYWMAHVQPQGRLMAVRAARVEGLRKLAERIGGIAINSETRVKDFVAESDKIKTITDYFLKGAREVGVKYHEDELIVEVEMEVTLRTVFETLKTYTEEHYKGDRVRIHQIEELEQSYQDKNISEVGMGVPPEKYLKDGNVAIVAQVASFNKWPGTIQATGQAAIDTNNENKAQAELMAKRGAELDARRKLAEQLDGLMITSATSVKDFITQSDDIRTSMLTFQQGATVVEGSQKIADGIATVTVEINPQPLMDMILYWQKTKSITVK